MSFGEESIRAERYELNMDHAKSLARPIYEYMMEKNLTLDQTLDHFNATGDFRDMLREEIEKYLAKADPDKD